MTTSIDEDALLAFLASNTINAFLYENIDRRGISSCTDYALSSGRPVYLLASPFSGWSSDVTLPRASYWIVSISAPD